MAGSWSEPWALICTRKCLTGSRNGPPTLGLAPPCSARPWIKHSPPTLLTEPLSQMLRYSYLLYRRDLEENVALIDSLAGHWPPPGGPSWLDRLSLAIVPGTIADTRSSTSRRVTTSNEAGACSSFSSPTGCPRPIDQLQRAPRWRSHTPTLVYADDPSAPPSARALPPDAFAAALEHSILARYAVRGSTADQEGKSFLHSKMLWEGDGELAREIGAAQP